LNSHLAVLEIARSGIALAQYPVLWQMAVTVRVRSNDQTGDMRDMSTYGYDLFAEPVDTKITHFCKVCGAETSVTKSVPFPTHFGHALGKKLDICNVHECPDCSHDWHITAVQLVKAIEGMPSKRVAELMRRDLDELLTDSVKSR
jgi:hypothetical protein